jgi:hypothetical protein
MHHLHDGSFGSWGFAPLQFADLPDPFEDRPPAYRSAHSRPILKCITIRLKADAFQYDNETRQEIAMNALAMALMSVGDGVPPAWRICPLTGQAPLSYDMMPLPGCRVGSQSAWEMTAALRAQPQIAAADPAFVIEDLPSST